jgi:acyl carrier protein
MNIKEIVTTMLKEQNLYSIEQLDLSSLDLITLAVNIEKKFNTRFELDDLKQVNFATIDSIAQLVAKKLINK